MLPRSKAKRTADGLEIQGGSSDGEVVQVLSIEALGELVGYPGLKWADERQWCKHAIAGERPAGCSMYGADDGKSFCKLNAWKDPSRRSLCNFDEPADAEPWQKILARRRR